MQKEIERETNTKIHLHAMRSPKLRSVEFRACIYLRIMQIPVTRVKINLQSNPEMRAATTSPQLTVMELFE